MSVKRWIPYLKIAIGISLLVYISGEIDLSILAPEPERRGDFVLWTLLAISIYFLAFSLTMLRWNLLLRAFSVPHRLADTFRLGWVGLFFSQVTPGATGGDLVKAYYITREAPHLKPEAVLSVILDRVVGLFALFVLGALACAVSWEKVRESRELTLLANFLAASVLLGLLGGASLAWKPLWQTGWIKSLLRLLPSQRILRRLAEAFWGFHGKRKLLLITLAISLVNHCVNVCLNLVVWRAMLGEFPEVGLFFFLIPLGMLANAIPISPGGLGVGEKAYQQLFRLSGLAHGAELAIFVRMITLLVSTIGVYYYIRGKKELQAAAAAAEKDALAQANAD